MAGRTGSPEAVPDQVVLRAGDARVVVRPAAGGRFGSVELAGAELLITGSPDGPIHWGAYPMVPWAGRIRNGRFSFRGHEHQLPLGMPPHAIHGVVFDRPWTVIEQTPASAALSIELDDRWPFRGRVTQRIMVEPGGLEAVLRLEADDAMPVTMGWHPWFRRRIGGSDAAPVALRFDPDRMLVRDPTGIPTGELVEPTPGPWDDAFTDLRSNPVLEWPGRLRLEISSTCRWWVAYTQPVDALCVEPQSGPPDAVNSAPVVVEAGGTLEHSMRWAWSTALDG
jgi:aldose 1-epimerase